MVRHVLRVFCLPESETGADLAAFLEHAGVMSKAVWLAVDAGVSQRWAFVEFHSDVDLATARAAMLEAKYVVASV